MKVLTCFKTLIYLYIKGKGGKIGEGEGSYFPGRMKTWHPNFQSILMAYVNVIGYDSRNDCVEANQWGLSTSLCKGRRAKSHF